MEARPIIIDADPGQDDAIAILLALASPQEIEVRGITTVAGNVPLPLTSRNARQMVELAGRTDVPVYEGCARPMVRPLYTAEYVHGPSGIDGADLPEPEMAVADGHAVDFIVDACLGAEEGLTICPVGPLTNVGMALIKEPRIVPRIREIVLMGGGFFEGGNTTPAAEFNIYVDPHAAHVVLTSGAPVTMMPLDVTHKAIVTQKHAAAFRGMGSPAGVAVAGMLDFYARHDVEKYNTEGAPLHDPCVIAYLLRAGLFSGRRCHVAVEISSELTMGMTVVDWWGVSGAEPKALVMNEVDADGFFELLIERIGQL